MDEMNTNELEMAVDNISRADEYEADDCDTSDYYCEDVPSASINKLFFIKGINFDNLFRVLHHKDVEDVDNLLETRDKPLVPTPKQNHYRLMDVERNDNFGYTIYHWYNWTEARDEVRYDDTEFRFRFYDRPSEKRKKVLAVARDNLQKCRASKEMRYIKFNEEKDKNKRLFYKKQAEAEKHNCRYRDKIYNSVLNYKHKIKSCKTIEGKTEFIY